MKGMANSTAKTTAYWARLQLASLALASTSARTLKGERWEARAERKAAAMGQAGEDCRGPAVMEEGLGSREEAEAEDRVEVVLWV
jgi:hypothetical protein